MCLYQHTCNTHGVTHTWAMKEGHAIKLTWESRPGEVMKVIYSASLSCPPIGCLRQSTIIKTNYYDIKHPRQTQWSRATGKYSDLRETAKGEDCDIKQKCKWTYQATQGQDSLLFFFSKAAINAYLERLQPLGVVVVVVVVRTAWHIVQVTITTMLVIAILWQFFSLT